ncbi:hypothetical protein M3Y98_00348700 [Aphelenchoides besseyi]|nr:hypothetical protein M3Y98_00348700 [Aphelenchoides besseyi]KAI6201602.1 hypothetical protein M3Y96_00859800 [Aphelenchoides besseyi]
MSWTSVEYEASIHTSRDIYDEDYFVNSTDLNDVEIQLALRAAYQSDPEIFRTLIAILVITTAFLGLVTNVFTMYIGINIQGDYRHFIANLVVVDILAFHHFNGLIGNCLLWKFWFGDLRAYSDFDFPPSQPKIYDQYFAGRRAVVICLASDLIPLFLLTIISFARHDVVKWLFFGFALLTVFAHMVTFVSNILVFRMVALHISFVQSLHDHTRLLRTRQIALVTLIQALVPLLCQVPAFLFLSSALLLVQPITHENVIVTTQFPLFDALISLFVIKQYRITTAQFCSRFFYVDCCILPRQKSSMIVEQHALTSFYSSIPTVRVATD